MVIAAIATCREGWGRLLGLGRDESIKDTFEEMTVKVTHMSILDS